MKADAADQRALLNAMVRQNEAGFIRGGELGVGGDDMDAMEAAGWLKRLNNAPHERRAYQLTKEGAAALMPADLKAMLRCRDDIASDANLTFRPDPDDDALMIGSNGHRYPATRLPLKWPFNGAFEVLDRLQPDAMPVNVRLVLSGLFAQLLGEVADRVRSQYGYAPMTVLLNRICCGYASFPANGNVMRNIADALNARGIPTARGGKWYAMTVRNALSRS